MFIGGSNLLKIHNCGSFSIAGYINKSNKNRFEKKRRLLHQLRLTYGTLVVAKFSFNIYPFLPFSYLTCHLEDTETCVSWLHGAAQ